MNGGRGTIATLAPRVAAFDQRAAPPPPKTADPIYSSPEWARLIATIIRRRGRRCEDPLCARGQMGLAPPPRVFGDHIIELRDGGAPFDERNVMLRCGACHTRKTAAARAERTRRRPEHPIAKDGP